MRYSKEAMNFNIDEEESESLIHEIDRRFPMLFDEIESLSLKSSKDANEIHSNLIA
jgi:hypothetical protein